MANFNFGINIGAKDDTKAGVGSVRSAFQSLRNSISKPFRIAFKMPRQALGLARDLRLTFGGLASQISQTLSAAITEGSSLEVVQKSFRQLTRTSAKDAQQLARYIQQSSNGTLTMANSMRIANRAMTGGIDVVSQLPLVLDFISKRSIATGKDAAQAIDTVVTGLSRGSTLFLDDFGILVDGIEGVKRTFDSIRGEGAFDSLGPAAQKAETIRQALKEMTQQGRLMGISGREQAFQLQSMANSIRDSVSGLVQVLTTSSEVRTVITGISDSVKGLTDHLRGGPNNSIFDFFIGKKGGTGQGLLGILKGLFKDIGVALGEGLLEPIRAFIARTPLADFIKVGKPLTAATTATATNPNNAGDASGVSPGRSPFSNTRKAIDAFRNDFTGNGSGNGKVDAPQIFNPNDRRLTEKGQRDRELAVNKLNREIRRREILSRREAYKRTVFEMRRLRRQGFIGEFEPILKQKRAELIQRTTGKLVERRDALLGQLGENDRRQEFAKRAADHQEKQLKESQAQSKLLSEIQAHLSLLSRAVPQAASVFGNLAGSIAGFNQRLAAARR